MEINSFGSQVSIIFLIFVIQFITCSVTVGLSARNPRLKFNTSVSPNLEANNNSTIIVNNKKGTTDHKYTSTESTVKQTPGKKWQVGRVSRKHYEIINMLWRKTKIFIDIENTTISHHFKKTNATKLGHDKHHRRECHEFSPAQPNFQTSTPSYIEFYYLDESNGRTKRKDRHMERLIDYDNKSSYPSYFKSILSNSQFLTFHVNNQELKQANFNFAQFPKSTDTGKYTRSQFQSILSTRNKPSASQAVPSKFAFKVTPKAKIKPDPFINKSNLGRKFVTKFKLFSHFINNETCPLTTETVNDAFDNFTSSTLNVSGENKMKSVILTPNDLHSTTVYDKIKFFEIYDRNTRAPYYTVSKKSFIDSNDDVENLPGENEINNDEKILLEHINMNIGLYDNQKSRYAKKHVREDNRNIANYFKSANLINGSLKTTSNNTGTKKTNNSNFATTPISSTSKASDSFFKDSKLDIIYNNTKIVSWSDFPFAAVYVYEPLRIHCDTAAISPHWLVATASCLYSDSKSTTTNSQTAFVAYCGEKWWQPERVTYVKHSFVHPRYNPTDNTRKRLYNIGMIQVVTSMASSCANWYPISLMSHQFIAQPEGSLLSAVGWGLDRYNMRYPAINVPKRPLMVYEGLVFSDWCPGNIGCSKAKRLDDGSANNVYCLSLPPYAGEDKDPVHGSLLLVGGKLIALYLQEERRSWGAQSAQYTGIWRLVPWILDVAGEPDDGDAFTLEI